MEPSSSKDGRWEPKRSLSAREFAVKERSDKFGRIVLRNRSNRFWGRVASGLTFGLTVALFNPIIAQLGPDPLSGAEVFLAHVVGIFISVTVELILARPYIRVEDTVLFVRNPIMEYRCDLTAVEEPVRGFMGFPKIAIQGYDVRLFSLEESFGAVLQGGSEEIAILTGLVNEAKSNLSENNSQTVSNRSLAISSPVLTALLCAWTFFFFWYYLA